MNGSERVKLSKVVEKMQLENMTPQIDISGTWLHIPEGNRPALQLNGFYNKFDNARIQIIGKNLVKLFAPIMHHDLLPAKMS